MVILSSTIMKELAGDLSDHVYEKVCILTVMTLN